jgi:hypothetical protein
MRRTWLLICPQRSVRRLEELLDENFPLALYHALKAQGANVEHIITLGRRGVADDAIRKDLLRQDVLFMTQDEEFLFDRATDAVIVLSRVRQSRPVKERVEIWRAAIGDLVGRPKPERRFELTDDGRLRPWREVPGVGWTS